MMGETCSEVWLTDVHRFIDVDEHGPRECWGGTPVVCDQPAVIDDRKLLYCFNHALRHAAWGWWRGTMAERQFDAIVRRWAAPIERDPDQNVWDFLDGKPE